MERSHHIICVQERRLDDQRCVLPKTFNRQIPSQEPKSVHKYLLLILKNGPPYPQICLERSSSWRVHQPSRHQLLYDAYVCPMVKTNTNANAYWSVINANYWLFSYFLAKEWLELSI